MQDGIQMYLCKCICVYVLQEANSIFNHDN